MSKLIYIIVSVLFNVAGQTAVKFGTTKLGEINLPFKNPLDLIPAVFKIITYPYILLGIICYAFGAIFWIVALSKNDLSFAYPFYGLGFVLIIIISWFLFNENITVMRLIGTLLVFTGIFLIFKS